MNWFYLLLILFVSSLMPTDLWIQAWASPPFLQFSLSLSLFLHSILLAVAELDIMKVLGKVLAFAVLFVLIVLWKIERRVRFLGHIFSVGDGNKFAFLHNFIVGETNQSAAGEQQIDEEMGWWIFRKKLFWASSPGFLWCLGIKHFEPHINTVDDRLKHDVYHYICCYWIQRNQDI